MAIYYVNMNAQDNGDHEVHRYDCDHLPAPENRRCLGDFPDCYEAVSKAKEIYLTKDDGCAFCSPECHTR